MKGEPLGFENRTFMVKRMIEQAPKRTVVRELFMNAQENAALAPENNRTVRIYSTLIGGVPKLTFWNTGPGMSADDLRTVTNLSSSLNKPMSLDGNFGIGAKVSGLAASPAGVRYRSCKEGLVHEVTIGYDEETQTYMRLAVRFADGGEDTVIDVTAVAEREGHRTDFDWTEVVLIGEREEHDTVSEPLGMGVGVSRSYLPTQIFQRFAGFKPGVEVQVEASITKDGGKGESGRYRTLKPLAAVLDKVARHEKVRCPRTGVVVHYLHDPKGANGPFGKRRGEPGDAIHQLLCAGPQGRAL